MIKFVFALMVAVAMNNGAAVEDTLVNEVPVEDGMVYYCQDDVMHITCVANVDSNDDGIITLDECAQYWI